MLLRICRSIAESFGFERIGVSRYYPERGEIELLAFHGVSDEASRAGVPRSLAEYPLLQRAAESGRADLRRGRGARPGSIPPEVAKMLGIRSAFAAPLVTEGRCLGFIGADKGGKPFSLDHHQLDLLAAIAAVVAVFLEKALDAGGAGAPGGAEERVHRLRLPRAARARRPHPHHRPDALCAGRRADREQVRSSASGSSRRPTACAGSSTSSSTSRGSRRYGIRMAPEPVPVRTRIEEILPTAAGERAAEVTVTVPPDLEVVVDPSGFDRIVSNLIANAVRYGDVPIVVSAEERDRTSASGSRTAGPACRRCSCRASSSASRAAG